MTTILTDNEQTVVAEAVAHLVHELESVSRNHWNFRLHPGDGSLGELRMSQDWLQFELPVGRRRSIGRIPMEHLERMLRANAQLAGGVAFGLTSTAPFISLSAELAVTDEDPFLPGAIERVISGLKQGLSVYAAEFPERSEEIAESIVAATDPSDESLEQWRTMFEEIGWPVTVRQSGRMVVELDVRDGFCQAAVEQQGEQTRLAVELEPMEEISQPSRHAMLALMLTASRIVRSARAVLTKSESGEVIRWEAVFDETPAGDELDRSLRALSVACRLTSREVNTLRNEVVAGEYLAVRGWSS